MAEHEKARVSPEKPETSLQPPDSSQRQTEVPITVEKSQQIAASIAGFRFRYEYLKDLATYHTSLIVLDRQEKGHTISWWERHKLNQNALGTFFRLYDTSKATKKSSVSEDENIDSSYKDLFNREMETIQIGEQDIRAHASLLDQSDRIKQGLWAIQKLQFGKLPLDQAQELFEISNFPKHVQENLLKSFAVTGITIGIFEGSAALATGIGAASMFLKDAPDIEKAVVMLAACGLNAQAINHNREKNREAIMKSGYCSNVFATITHHALRSVIPDRTDIQWLATDIVSILPGMVEIPLTVGSITVGDDRALSAAALRNFVSAFYQFLAAEGSNGLIIHEQKILDMFKRVQKKSEVLFRRSDRNQ